MLFALGILPWLLFFAYSFFALGSRAFHLELCTLGIFFAYGFQLRAFCLGHVVLATFFSPTAFWPWACGGLFVGATRFELFPMLLADFFL